MTQPDEATNAGAANYGSLSSWSSQTQGDWQSSISTPFAGALGPIGSFFGMIVGLVGGIISTIIGIFVGGIGLIGGVIGGIIGAIGSFFGGLFGGFTGQSAGQGAAPMASAFDVHLGADGMRKTIVSLQSDVQAMRFDQLPPGSVVYIDNATDGTDDDWGPDWTLHGTGATHRVGNRGFVWDPSGSFERQIIGISDHQTTSDLQVVGIIFHSLPQAGACNLLLGRIGESGDSFVYAAIFADRVELGCYVHGVKHVIETALGSPSTASLWELQCGTEDDDDNILVYQNRRTIIDNSDSTPALKGSAYRSGGHGMRSGEVYGSPERIPGDVSQFTLRDLAPPSVIGTGMRVRNLSTTPYAMTHGLISTLPNGLFNAVDYCSADIDWDPSLTQATISTEGHYRISWSVLFTTFLSSITVYPAYFQNTAAMLGGPITGSAGTDYQIRSVLGGFETYCVPGDKLFPGLGISSGSDLNITGEGTGILSWMTITKIG